MKLRTIVVTALTLALTLSCSKLNDLQSQLDEQNARITKLESLCSSMNESIDALVILTDALEQRDYITGVEKITEGGTVTGYKISFGFSETITIPFGKDGKSPDLSIKEDEGIWYWTLNGEYLKDSDGNRLKVEGVTPQFKIENDLWFVSYDKGSSWNEVGTAAYKSLISDIKVSDGNVIFTLYDGTVLSLPLSDNFNIPSGIVMITSDLGEVHRDDTTSLYIRVNPSNFPLEEENVDLLVTHDIYTSINEGPLPSSGEYPEVFDETVQSEIKFIGLKKDETQDGMYKVTIAIGGKGNYYDNAGIFVIVKNKDSKGEERSTCSATRCTANVTPHLSEAFFVESPVQSFYLIEGFDKKATKIKPFIVGLWSKTYINKSGLQRVYDRSDVTVESVSATSCSSLATGKYQDYGIITLTPDTTSVYWKNAIKLKDKQKSVKVPETFLTLKRDNLKGETAEIPFNFKSFFPCDSILSKTLSIKEDKVMTTVFNLDYTEFRDECGYGEFVRPWFNGEQDREKYENCMLSKDEEKEGYCFNLRFMYHRPQAGKTALAAYMHYQYMSMGQDKGGKSAELPSDFENVLLNYSFVNNYTFVE